MKNLYCFRFTGDVRGNGTRVINGIVISSRKNIEEQVLEWLLDPVVSGEQYDDRLKVFRFRKAGIYELDIHPMLSTLTVLGSNCDHAQYNPKLKDHVSSMNTWYHFVSGDKSGIAIASYEKLNSVISPFIKEHFHQDIEYPIVCRPMTNLQGGVLVLSDITYFKDHIQTYDNHEFTTIHLGATINIDRIQNNDKNKFVNKDKNSNYSVTDKSCNLPCHDGHKDFKSTNICKDTIPSPNLNDQLLKAANLLQEARFTLQKLAENNFPKDDIATYHCKLLLAKALNRTFEQSSDISAVRGYLANENEESNVKLETKWEYRRNMYRFSVRLENMDHNVSGLVFSDSRHLAAYDVFKALSEWNLTNLNPNQFLLDGRNSIKITKISSDNDNCIISETDPDAYFPKEKAVEVNGEYRPKLFSYLLPNDDEGFIIAANGRIAIEILHLTFKDKLGNALYRRPIDIKRLPDNESVFVFGNMKAEYDNRYHVIKPMEINIDNRRDYAMIDESNTGSQDEKTNISEKSLNDTKDDEITVERLLRKVLEKYEESYIEPGVKEFVYNLIDRL